jgi:hypothetical protein
MFVKDKTANSAARHLLITSPSYPYSLQLLDGCQLLNQLAYFKVGVDQRSGQPSSMRTWSVILQLCSVFIDLPLYTERVSVQ